MFERTFAVINRARKVNDEQNHIADRKNKKLMRVVSRRRGVSDELRVISRRQPDNDDQRRQRDARHSHRHMQFDIFRANQRDLRDEIKNPNRHHDAVRVNERVSDRSYVKKCAEIIRLEVSG